MEVSTSEPLNREPLDALDLGHPRLSLNQGVSVFIFVNLIKIKTNLLYKIKAEAYYLLKIQSILLIIKLFSVNTQRSVGWGLNFRIFRIDIEASIR